MWNSQYQLQKLYRATTEKRKINRKLKLRKIPSAAVQMATLTQPVPLRMNPTSKREWAPDHKAPLPIGSQVKIFNSKMYESSTNDENGYPMHKVAFYFNDESFVLGWIYDKNLQIENVLHDTVYPKGSTLEILSRGKLDENGVEMVKVKAPDGIIAWTYFQNFIADDRCCICVEEIQTRDLFTSICGHQFHKGCIDTWLQNNTSCPVCRQPVAPQNYMVQ